MPPCFHVSSSVFSCFDYAVVKHAGHRACLPVRKLGIGCLFALPRRRNATRRVKKIQEENMSNDGFDRRAFLKSAVVGGAAAATVNVPQPAEAQTTAPAATSPGYAFFNPEEGAFVEALVDH